VEFVAELVRHKRLN